MVVSRLKSSLRQFLSTARFRTSLAWAVLRGRIPQRQEQRPWRLRQDSPVLLDFSDWVDSRELFSIIVWPPLDKTAAGRSGLDTNRRVSQVIGAFERACDDLAWSTYITRHDLVWDARREAWVCEADGSSYEHPEPRFERHEQRVFGGNRDDDQGEGVPVG